MRMHRRAARRQQVWRMDTNISPIRRGVPLAQITQHWWAALAVEGLLLAAPCKRFIRSSMLTMTSVGLTTVTVTRRRTLRLQSARRGRRLPQSAVGCGLLGGRRSECQGGLPTRRPRALSNDTLHWCSQEGAAKRGSSLPRHQSDQLDAALITPPPLPRPSSNVQRSSTLLGVRRGPMRLPRCLWYRQIRRS